MSAHTNVVEVFCNGPGDVTVCPFGAVESSRFYAVDDLRTQLAESGWQVDIRRYDLPSLDRCPACGKGTP